MAIKGLKVTNSVVPNNLGANIWKNTFVIIDSVQYTFKPDMSAEVLLKLKFYEGEGAYDLGQPAVEWLNKSYGTLYITHDIASMTTPVLINVSMRDHIYDKVKEHMELPIVSGGLGWTIQAINTI